MNLNTLIPKLNNTNITQYMISHGYSKERASEISYAVQTGTYEKTCLKNIVNFNSISKKRAKLVNKYISQDYTILDCGCGELTTVSLESNYLLPHTLYAFDISLNRILHGVGFYKQHGNADMLLHPFCADMSDIPLPDSSIDIVKTVHALEPNGGCESQILQELFRVSKKYVILFEPCYENEPLEFQKYMDSHGYVKNLKNEIEKLNGTILEDFTFHDNHNNHPCGVKIGRPNTHCFVIEVTKKVKNNPQFICPISKVALKHHDNYTHGGGYIYSKINNIPILRKNNAVIFIG